MKSFFTETLLKWHAEHPRPMPWSGEKDPYRIWLSETILQQTRVEQGTPYYLQLIQTYPTIADLANAPEDELLRIWQGLGYYRRARNLHVAAQFIVHELNNCFPNSYEALLQLKGVGDYTAAAIASFGFDLPHAVLDGNVYRVLSRFCGIETPIDDPKDKTVFSKLAHILLDKAQPAIYNQAIMNFGAIQCVPQSPSCGICPMKTYCFAFQQQQVHLFPMKSKKITKKQRFFNFLLFREGDSIWIQQRREKDIWQQLYALPLIETDCLLETDDAFIEHFEAHFETDLLQIPIQIIQKSVVFKQKLSHLQLMSQFWEVRMDFTGIANKTHCFKINLQDLTHIAFPKVILDYFNSYDFFKPM
jgi:A/G-specific adenine glycosylase